MTGAVTGEASSRGPVGAGLLGSGVVGAGIVGAGIVGVGIDAVEIARMHTILSRTPSFAERVFTADELAYARTAHDPTERLAARFAAKEAFLKALGQGLGACEMADVEVVRAPSGAPSLRLHASAALLSSRHGVAHWEISLTHTDTLAMAIALAIGPSAGHSTTDDPPSNPH